MQRFNIITFKLKKEETETINKILEYIKSITSKEIEYKTYDVAVVKFDITRYPAIIFGEAAKRTISFDQDTKYWVFPDIKLLIKKEKLSETYEKAKTKSLILVKEIINFLEEDTLQEKELTELTVEKNGVTFGKSITDINLTEKEVTYLKEIKDLLNGCKIKITKGDITLEIE